MCGACFHTVFFLSKSMLSFHLFFHSQVVRLSHLHTSGRLCVWPMMKSKSWPGINYTYTFYVFIFPLFCWRVAFLRCILKSSPCSFFHDVKSQVTSHLYHFGFFSILYAWRWSPLKAAPIALILIELCKPAETEC